MTTNILVLKDRSQYDVLSHFADAVSDGFEKEGYTVTQVDFRQPNAHAALNHAFAHDPVFVFAFNAIGYDIQKDGQSIYDALNIPYIAFLVDHPMYHIIRLNQKMANRKVICVDPSHLHFISNYYGDSIEAYHIPHGGTPPATEPNPFEKRNTTLLFCGSYYDPEPYRKRLEKLPQTAREVLSGLIDMTTANPLTSLSEHAAHLLEGMNGSYTQRQYRELTKALITVDQFLIASHRQQVLRELQEHDIPMTICGNGWENSPFASCPSTTIEPCTSCSGAMQRMTQAQMVLNMVPSFPGGSHERIYTAMLHGAAVITNEGHTIREQFNGKEDIILYNGHQLDQLSNRIKGLIAQPHRLELLALHGQRAALTHTWQLRSAQILCIALDA